MGNCNSSCCKGESSGCCTSGFCSCCACRCCFTLPKVRNGLAPLPDSFPKKKIKGKIVYRPNGGEVDEEYILACYQYAYSSRENGSMSPAAIVYVADVADMQEIIRWAPGANVGIAVRSGGHQFGGFSSTTGANVVIDTSHGAEFTHFVDNKDGVVQPDGRHKFGTYTFGTGNRLMQVEEWFQKNTDGAFFGHGGCSHVGVGGHFQTGGMGMFTRALGMFIDWITKFRIVLADGRHVTVTKPATPVTDATDFSTLDENAMLWYGVPGGGACNFGIVTDVTVKPAWDSQMPESRAYSKIYLYWGESSKSLVESCMKRICEMNDNNEYPANYSLSFAVASTSRWGALPTTDEWVMKYHPERYGSNTVTPHPFNAIAVQASWLNLSGDPAAYDDSVKAFFTSLDDAAYGHTPLYVQYSPEKAMSVSEMVIGFTYQNVREFECPYMKRNYASNVTNLNQRGYPKWVADRVHDNISSVGCKVSFQTSPLGGKYSKLGVNAASTGTVLQWRDQTMHMAFDQWYQSPEPGLVGIGPMNTLAGLVQRVQAEAVGTDASPFSTKEMRYTWAPFSQSSYPGVVDYDADHKYYVTEEQYQRMVIIKKRFDPKFVFNSGKWGVLASQSPVVQAMNLDQNGVPASVNNGGTQAVDVLYDHVMSVGKADAVLLQRSYNKNLLPEHERQHKVPVQNGLDGWKQHSAPGEVNSSEPAAAAAKH